MRGLSAVRHWLKSLCPCAVRSCAQSLRVLPLLFFYLHTIMWRVPWQSLTISELVFSKAGFPGFLIGFTSLKPCSLIISSRVRHSGYQRWEHPPRPWGLFCASSQISWGLLVSSSIMHEHGAVTVLHLVTDGRWNRAQLNRGAWLSNLPPSSHPCLPGTGITGVCCIPSQAQEVKISKYWVWPWSTSLILWQPPFR